MDTEIHNMKCADIKINNNNNNKQPLWIKYSYIKKALFERDFVTKHSLNRADSIGAKKRD